MIYFQSINCSKKVAMSFQIDNDSSKLSRDLCRKSTALLYRFILKLFALKIIGCCVCGQISCCADHVKVLEKNDVCFSSFPQNSENKLIGSVLTMILFDASYFCYLINLLEARNIAKHSRSNLTEPELINFVPISSVIFPYWWHNLIKHL